MEGYRVVCPHRSEEMRGRGQSVLIEFFFCLFYDLACVECDVFSLAVKVTSVIALVTYTHDSES